MRLYLQDIQYIGKTAKQRVHGGTLIVVNSGIPSSQVSSPDNLEMVVVSVHFYHPVTIIDLCSEHSTEL